MSAFDPTRSPSGSTEEMGFLRKTLSRLILLVFVVGSLGFTIILLAAATGYLDTLKKLVGL